MSLPANEKRAFTCIHSQRICRSQCGNYILKQKRPCAWLPGGDGVPLGEDVGLGLDPGPDLGLAVVVGDPLLAPAPRLRLLSLQLGLLVLLQLLLRLDDVELVALGQHLHAPAILVVLQFL